MIEATDKKIYNSIITRTPHAEFLESWEWGEFQNSQGRKAIRWMDEAGQNAGQAFIHRSIAGSSYIYWPRGKGDNDFFEQSMEFLKKKYPKSLWIRVEPALEVGQTPSCLQKSKPAPSLQPADTIILDLSKSEDELLASMKPKTRYNIRLARKKGVKIVFDKSEKNLNALVGLIEETSIRHKIKAHPKQYYIAMFSALKEQPGSGLKIYLASAEYQGSIIASHILVGFGDTMVYVHGASSEKHQNAMAPYLVQWESMQKAKQEGYAYYDLFGIAPKDDDSKPNAQERRKKWAGITRFKQGFNGKKRYYIGAFDIILRSGAYRAYQIYQKIRTIA